MITQPRWGIFGQRYGSFAGKSSVSGPHPVGKITQPRWGVFGQRYGNFSEKGVAVAAVPAVLDSVFIEEEFRQRRRIEEEELVLLVAMLHNDSQAT